MKIVLFVLFCGCLFVHPQYLSYSQRIPFDNYTLENGLAHSNVLRLFQDSQGYLWLGTQYGLSRFDGESFINYTASEGLASNTVMSMNDLPDSSLLVSSYQGGMSILRRGEISPYKMENTIPGKILYTSVDKRGRIWIITKGGVKGGSWESGYVDSSRYHSFPLYQYLGEKAPFEVYRILPLADSSVVMATERGAFIVSSTGKIASAGVGLTMPLYVVVQDRSGALWFSGNGRLYKLSKSTEEPEVISIAHSDIINVLLAARDGSIWCYTREHGLFCLKENTLTNYTLAFSLNNTIVNELLEDREGSLWIGSYNHGVYRVGDFRMRNYTVEAGLVSNYVSAVTEDETGRIWVGCMGGIGIIEQGESFRALPSQWLHSDDIINALLVVNGECWATSPYRMVGITAEGKSRKLRSVGSVSLCRTPTDVYVGTYRGYFSTQPVWKPMAEQPSLMDLRINSMLYDSAALWLATDVGVYCRRGSTLYHHSAVDGFSAKEANALCRDSSGTIWCATDNGVYAYNGSWRAFTVADGMSHNRCSSVLCDRSGTVWIGTLRGVNRFDGKKFTWYNAHKGLAGDEVNTLFLDSKDHLWIGTVNGLTQFDIGRNYKPIPQPPVYITDVKVNDKSAALQVAPVLEAYENTLYFQFRAIQLGNYRDVLYRYKLAGSNDTWATTKETAVRYSSLPPGNYTFIVQAALSQDAWPKAQSARYTFTVNIPYWQTWWFISSCCVALALLVVAAVRIREHWFKRRQAEKLSVYSRMLNLRQQALTALVNPHFVFNALNSIQFFINRSNKELANEYLANFADLIRRTMEDSQSVVVPLRDELSRLELYLELEALRFSNRFRYAVYVDPDLDIEETLIPVMLIQPYVENSIWHGIMPKDGRGEVRVVIRKVHDSRLNIVVEDDGVGIEAGRKKKHNPQHHISRGMNIMQERLELISKMANESIVISVRELTDADGEPCGTRVELELPLGLEHIATGPSVLE